MLSGLTQIAGLKLWSDIAGHYSRPDVLHYRLPGEKTFHSTQIKSDKKVNKRRAEQWVLKNKIGRTYVDDMPFAEYADPYFVWNRCPRIRRRLAENNYTLN